MNLLAIIDRWGNETPDRLAHVGGGRTLSHGELKRASDRVAAHLTARLAGDRSPVAVRGHKEPEMLVAFLGAVKAGHPYVPLDTSIPPQRAERIVAAAGARLVLTPEEIGVLAQTPAPHVSPRPVAAADPFYIIFTSGSTGEPKGVVITLECLTSFVTWMLEEQRFREGSEVFLNQAPFSFDLSVMDLYLSLATGSTLFSITAAEIANPILLFRALASSGVTAWVSTPSFAQMCLAERTFGSSMLPGLRRLLFCGETLPHEVAAQLRERFPVAAVWNTYGPTEATVATTSVEITDTVLDRFPVLPVGYPKPGTAILIQAEDGSEMSPGERGEIVIAGPNVSPGYLGRPDLNARSFFLHEGRRAYRSGDWGRLRDGLLFFEGRIDSQVKLHGYRIELGDVEANLRALPGVIDAAVIPVTKDGTIDSLAAFVVAPEQQGDGGLAAIARMRAELGRRLPVYMVPRTIHFVTALPLTANGKADRRKLAEMLA